MLLTKDKGFYKTLLSLAIPIALGNLITFTVNLADNLMIGSLGDSAVSGVYMGSQIQTLLQIFSVGIEGAILVLSAQYWGKKDVDYIKKIISAGTKSSLAFGGAVALFSFFAPELVIYFFTKSPEIINTGSAYLKILSLSFPFFCLSGSLVAAMRSIESAKVALCSSSLALLINIFLNYILIFGNLGAPRLGISGAAIASVISRITEFLSISLFSFFKDKKLNLKLKDIITFDKEAFVDFIKHGTPIILGQLIWAANTLFASAIIGRLTDSGAVAGVGIAGALGNIIYVISGGLSGAVGIITGKTVGSGAMERMREYAKTLQIIFVALGLFCSAVIFFLKDPFISLYSVSISAKAQASLFINILAITAIGTCYQTACLSGLVKSGGDVSYVFKTDLFFIVFAVVPLTLLSYIYGAPAWVVFAALKCDQILKCTVAFFKVNKFDWMKNLTKNNIKKSPAS